MPIYIFEHPQSGEHKEIVLSVKEDKVYIEKGVKWNRVFTVPTASIDTKISPDSQRDFIEKTRGKKGKLGDLFDKSRELSEQRQSKNGIDPVKKAYLDNWSKKRKRDHPEIRKEKAKSIADKAGIVLTD